MNKKEWQEHCKWLDTFRGEIITQYNQYGKTFKKTEKIIKKHFKKKKDK